MKTRIHALAEWLLAALFLLTICLIFAPEARAQDVTVPANTIILSPDAQNFVLTLLGKLIESHPWLATVIAFVGSMRLWAKPVFTALHALTELTPSKFDDGLWAMVHRFFVENPVGRFLAYLLDWLGSVKITPPAKPTEPTAGTG